jgi:polyphosphate kinase
VVRSDPDGTLRRYVHVGTGNYNPKTARVYEDLGLLTADEEVGADVADLFNHLSGYTRHRDYSSLLVAPDFLRSRLLAMIAGEAEHARAGRPSGISLKVNNLVDIEIIDALYDASSAGVPMDLVVRGMCALRPGQPGLSESIRVRSILGRFLEHSRIYRFNNGGDPQTWIGSADVMDRNLDRRVEALVRVRDEEGVRLLDLLLELSWADGVDCWTLDGKGEWQRTAPAQRLIDYQSELAARRRPFDAADAGRGE